jgi:hypothetical protein
LGTKPCSKVHENSKNYPKPKPKTLWEGSLPNHESNNNGKNIKLKIVMLKT